MNPSVTALGDNYVLSQAEVAEKLFLCINTVASDEKKAIEKFKQEFAARGYDIKDLL